MAIVPGMQDKPRQREGGWLAQSTGEAVLLDPDGRAPYLLNDTAVALWQLCDGKTSVGEMVDAVCELYAEDRQRLEEDVISVLQGFTEAGLIEWTR